MSEDEEVLNMFDHDNQESTSKSSGQKDKEKSGNHAKRNIGIVFIINLIFSVVEFVFGVIFNSVAIMSDAVHDLGDAVSSGFAWFFQKYSEKERNDTYTFGYSRFSLLGALVTATVLLGGSLFIIYRSIPRLINPEPVDVTGMMWLSIAAIMLNGFATIILSRGSSKNEKVLSLHMLEDVLGWVGVLVVSIAMRYTDWYRLDPMLSIVISGYIFYLTVPQFLSTMKILLDRAPENTNVEEIIDKIKGISGVQEISDFHIWSIDGQENALVATVLIEADSSHDRQNIKDKIREIAAENNVNKHVTIEMTTDLEEFKNKKVTQKDMQTDPVKE